MRLIVKFTLDTEILEGSLRLSRLQVNLLIKGKINLGVFAFAATVCKIIFDSTIECFLTSPTLFAVNSQ
jgi:hypothetical protein